MSNLQEVIKVRVYCQARRITVLRKFQVDADLEIQRKLANVTLVEIKPDSYALYKMGSMIAKSCGFCSVPAYLFGEDYRFARQSGDSRDLRKSNYTPVAKK